MARRVRVIGAPTDFGTNRRGVDMGPSAIRYAGLVDRLEGAGVEAVDAGDVEVPVGARSGRHEGDARFLSEVMEVTDAVSTSVEAALDDGAFPLVLGGDHSVAIGTLRGASTDGDLGVVWLDAHADVNTPGTSPSGNVHGMPVAAALGYGEFGDIGWARAPGLSEENLAWVGLRSLDPGERRHIRESEATAFTMSDVDDRGIGDVVGEALSVAADGTDAVHVSLDMDFLDPNEAPGVGTPVRGGVTYREAHTAMEAVADLPSLQSLEIVEVNPILDDRNETGTLAAELAASALGKEIL